MVDREPKIFGPYRKVRKNNMKKILLYNHFKPAVKLFGQGFNEKEKSIVVNLMSKINEILGNHQIKRSLIYGTLLGAVRHGGIIPWDDDVDIIISKKDSKKVIEILEKECGINDMKFRLAFPFLKISNSKNYFPFLDIFTWEDFDEYIEIPVKNGNFKLFKKNIEPFFEKKFENIKFPIFNDPIPFLDRHYPNWETLIETSGWNHRHEKGVRVFKYDIVDNSKTLNRNNWRLNG